MRHRPPFAALAVALAAAAPSPPAPDPAAAAREIEAAEAAALARLEALAAPASAQAISKRLGPALEAARQKAYAALYGDENPYRFYAEKDLGADGYQADGEDAVLAATDAVDAIFSEGLLRDPEASRAYEDAFEALEATERKREALGLAAAPRRPEELLALANGRIAEALTPAPDLEVLRANAGAAKDLDPMEREAMERINRYRIALGFRALRADPRLCRAAKGHSEEQARLGYQGHDSPTPGRRSPGDRARLAGYPGGVGENIERIWVKDGAASPLEGWRRSPPHHKNMLAPYRDLGIGRATDEGIARPAEEPPPDGRDPSPGADPPPRKKKGRGKGPRVNRYWTAVFGGMPAAEARALLGPPARPPSPPPAPRRKRP